MDTETRAIRIEQAAWQSIERAVGTATRARLGLS